jgi:hypothetical protein
MGFWVCDGETFGRRHRSAPPNTAFASAGLLMKRPDARIFRPATSLLKII